MGLSVLDQIEKAVADRLKASDYFKETETHDAIPVLMDQDPEITKKVNKAVLALGCFAFVEISGGSDEEGSGGLCDFSLVTVNVQVIENPVTNKKLPTARQVAEAVVWELNWRPNTPSVAGQVLSFRRMEAQPHEKLRIYNITFTTRGGRDNAPSRD